MTSDPTQSRKALRSKLTLPIDFTGRSEELLVILSRLTEAGDRLQIDSRDE